MNISQLIEFNRLAREDGRKYEKRRKLYDEIIKDTGAHFIGIVGPRGAGKTVLLKQLALTKEASFYVSLDTIDGDLFDLVKTLRETMQIRLFC